MDAGHHHIGEHQPGRDLAGGGRPEGETVDRRVVEGRDRDGRDDALGQHAADGLVDTEVVWRQRVATVKYVPTGLVERDHRGPAISRRAALAPPTSQTIPRRSRSSGASVSVNIRAEAADLQRTLVHEGDVQRLVHRLEGAIPTFEEFNQPVEVGRRPAGTQRLGPALDHRDHRGLGGHLGQPPEESGGHEGQVAGQHQDRSPVAGRGQCLPPGGHRPHRARAGWVLEHMGQVAMARAHLPDRVGHRRQEGGRPRRRRLGRPPGSTPCQHPCAGSPLRRATTRRPRS